MAENENSKTNSDMSVVEAAQALSWYAEMGVDEAIGEAPVDCFAQSAELMHMAKQQASDPPARADNGSKPSLKRPAPPPAAKPLPPRQPEPANAISGEEAASIANACNSLDELARTLDQFDACPLKRTATRLCFADGLPGAHVMVVGEAPGRDEDQQGRPFVGRSGQLLDKMLGLIGLDRQNEEPEKSLFISNIVFWRPPGNRKPSTSEVVMCVPFVRRAIELAKPKLVIAAGGTPAHALLNTTTGITKLRGRWESIELSDGPVPVMPTLHPSYLLRSPEAKRYAWQDILAVRERLAEHG